MITRLEYNTALDVVEAYQKQIFSINIPDLRNVGKTTILNWIPYHTCSTRLHNVLRENFVIGDFFLEDIDKDLFFRFRNGGMKSWLEFVELRGY